MSTSEALLMELNAELNEEKRLFKKHQDQILKEAMEGNTLMKQVQENRLIHLKAIEENINIHLKPLLTLQEIKMEKNEGRTQELKKKIGDKAQIYRKLIEEFSQIPSSIAQARENLDREKVLLDELKQSIKQEEKSFAEKDKHFQELTQEFDSLMKSKGNLRKFCSFCSSILLEELILQRSCIEEELKSIRLITTHVKKCEMDFLNYKIFQDDSLSQISENVNLLTAEYEKLKKMASFDESIKEDNVQLKQEFRQWSSSWDFSQVEDYSNQIKSQVNILQDQCSKLDQISKTMMKRKEEDHEKLIEMKRRLMDISLAVQNKQLELERAREESLCVQKELPLEESIDEVFHMNWNEFHDFLSETFSSIVSDENDAVSGFDSCLEDCSTPVERCRKMQEILELALEELGCLLKSRDSERNEEDQVRMSIKEAESKLKNLTEDIATFHSTKASLEQEVKELDSQLASLRDKHKGSLKDLEESKEQQLKALKEDYERKVEDLTCKLQTEYCEQTQRFRKEMEALDREIADLELAELQVGEEN